MSSQIHCKVLDELGCIYKTLFRYRLFNLILSVLLLLPLLGLFKFSLLLLFALRSRCHSWVFAGTGTELCPFKGRLVFAKSWHIVLSYRVTPQCHHVVP